MLAAGAIPCTAQEEAIAPKPEVAPPVPKPVATDDQMLHKYVWSTIGFDGALSATVWSSFDQWQDTPPQWDQHANGYARRWVSNYAASAIGNGAKYAVAHFFHQDPSYYKCECTGFRRRLHHAIDSPFMGRKRDGTRVLSAASLAGILASNVVPASTWYPEHLGTRAALELHASTSLLTQMGLDVFKEFWKRP